MNLSAALALLAGIASLALAAASVVRQRRTFATAFFVCGTIALGVDSLLTSFALAATTAESASRWVAASMVVKCLIPVAWLAFSLTYSRGDSRERLGRWSVPLTAIVLVSAGAVLIAPGRLFDVLPAQGADATWHLRLTTAGAVLNGALLVVLVLALLHLEQTFRAAVGTMRWRLKFVTLALVVILGTRLYVHSQQVLFSIPDISVLWGLDAAALLIGCLFLTVAYVRTGWAEASVYPSSAVVRSSVTVLVVGAYLFVVGVLAQVVGRIGGVTFLQLQTIVVLLGLTGLALLLLSDRARRRLHTFTARHFGKAQHDSVRMWTTVSEQMGRVTDAQTLGRVTARLMADTFDVLSASVWLFDPNGELKLVAATGREAAGESGPQVSDSTSVLAGLYERSAPFDLDHESGGWAEALRRLNPATFPNGGTRMCVPLRTGSQTMGALVLVDRVNGAPYTVEEIELLRCTAAQVTAVLLNLRLAEDVARARELDAFRTMSTFFVHDLKNAAASLNLMLQNLPVHFDDPAFRADALRGIGNTARRIDDMIGRLNELRERPDLVRIEADLNSVVEEALDQIGGTTVPVSRCLEPVPKILGDRDQLRSVVTNLVMNARDALGAGGQIEVRTAHQPGHVTLSVTDNGCGMTETFVRDSLFRPFQTTKKSGLGIGLFQTRTIVLAHGGQIHVNSRVGEGTTFVATFPVQDA